jgi:hypothetical protein
MRRCLPPATCAIGRLVVARVYLHYRDREECAPNGMWRNVSQRERDAYTLVTAELMRFPDKFEQAMLRALAEWPNSCEVVFTAPSMNHQAWLGHAGCFLATQSPEDATRLGWHQLTLAEQHRANAAADRVISEWKRRRKYQIAAGQLSLMGEDVA